MTFKHLRAREEHDRKELVQLAHHSTPQQDWQERPSTVSDGPENQGTTSKEVDFGVPKAVGRSWEQLEDARLSNQLQLRSTEITAHQGAVAGLPGCSG